MPLAAPVSKRLDILRLRCEIGEGKIQERINRVSLRINVQIRIEIFNQLIVHLTFKFEHFNDDNFFRIFFFLNLLVVAALVSKGFASCESGIKP